MSSAFEIRYDVRSWYYDPADPSQRPGYLERYERTSRPCTLDLNFDLRLFGPQPPPNWINVRERSNHRLCFAPPPRPDVVSVCLSWPLVALLFGYLPSRLVLSTFAAVASRRRGRPQLRRSVRACDRLMCVTAATGTWLWLAAVVVLAACELLRLESAALDRSIACGLLLALMLFLAGMLGATSRLVSMDRARLIFPSKLAAALLIILPLLGGPLLVLFKLLR